QHRAKLAEAYRSVYAPLREELVRRVHEARTSIVSMPEFALLTASNQAEVRAEFLAEGRPLAEVTARGTTNEEQLVAATKELSIPHARARLAALSQEVTEAKGAVLKLMEKQPDTTDDAPALWDPGQFFKGIELTKDDEVDAIFDSA